MPKSSTPKSQSDRQLLREPPALSTTPSTLDDFKALPGETGAQTYARWFQKQPKERQRELTAQGLAPEAPDGKVDANWVFEVQPDHSAYSTDEKEKNHFDEEPAPPRLYTEDDLLETIRRVVMAMQLSESPEVLFQARCILIAFGIGEPPTETELAKQKNCSRQFVSKKVKRIQQLFNLSPSQYMRSEAACKAYAKAWQRQQEKSKPAAEDTELPL